MKRQSIMDTYKEIKAAYSNDAYVSTSDDKPYLVGIDDNGIMVVSLNFRDTRGLSEVVTVVAANSEQARCRYTAIKVEEYAAQNADDLRLYELERKG